MTSQIVLGSAGYGTSTLLMAVAAWFAQNKVGTTLFLRPGMTPIPADVEFAARYFPTPIVFCIDNAADYERDLNEINQQLRALDIPAFLLLGERLNEWRQCRPSLRPAEFSLDPLSDDEIVRLVQSLEDSNSLGKLGDLDSDLRLSAIKIKNQQQLLVTMREATEGRAFDAIIEDEYRQIGDEQARELYGVVCAFSRVRALARDMLCAEVLGVNGADLYRVLVGGLEGILVWETVDEARGIEALRARHQIIADIVWNRCLDRADHERILLAALDRLNLTFGGDAKAFEAFTRDEHAIDGLQSLEAKSRFYELACRKDPTSGFVRQHYARMLLREGKHELALAQIDQAIDLAPRARAIHHTRGVILRDMALSATSPELGRKRLAQSEAAFEGALLQNPRDEYSFQSLAELYFDWAVRASDPAETVDYLNRAQEVVFRGLQVVRQREGLYLVTSKIQREAGNLPARLGALRQALTAAPNSAVVRYVLGTTLRGEKAYDEAAEVLLDGLKLHPDDPHLALALALTYYENRRELSEAIAVLHLARMKGARDPLFTATYGGMLTLDSQFDEAQDVWKRASEQNFSVPDLNQIGFRPKVDDRPLRLTGRASVVKANFAFIATPGYPDFFCPGHRMGKLRIQEGDVVEFEVAFTARGPVVASISTA